MFSGLVHIILSPLALLSTSMSAYQGLPAGVLNPYSKNSIGERNSLCRYLLSTDRSSHKICVNNQERVISWLPSFLVARSRPQKRVKYHPQSQPCVGEVASSFLVCVKNMVASRVAY